MSVLESALLRCTSPAGPSFAATPFPAVVDGQPVRIATDGKLLLMVDDPGGDADAECDPVVLGLINRYSNPPTLHASRADMTAWAGQDYRTPCPECDGEGWTGTPCTSCKTSGFLHNEKVSINIPALAISLDAHLIGGLFDLLPGDEIGISGDVMAAAFYGPGWKLIVAVVSTNAIPIRQLHVYAKSEVSA